jgi:hypothetical protein
MRTLLHVLMFLKSTYVCKINNAMNTKLTLKVEEDVVKNAKEYARAAGRSLSDIVENYLKMITTSTKNEKEYSPRIKRLKGSFHVPENFDYNEERTKALSEKYGI